MKNTDQIKALAVAIEEKDNQIRMLLAQQGNHEVQIAEYRQIVRELSDKLELYESKYGVVFKSSRNSYTTSTSGIGTPTVSNTWAGAEVLGIMEEI